MEGFGGEASAERLEDTKSDLDNNCVHSMRRDDDDDCNYAR